MKTGLFLFGMSSVPVRSGGFFCTFFSKNDIQVICGNAVFVTIPTDSCPCSFTGKELDEETGYSYHGARYYDPDLSGLFISVDRFADKYPFISPYAYCAWNPKSIIDPMGDTIEFRDENAREMFNKVYNQVSSRMIVLKNKGLRKEKRKEEYETLAKIMQSMDDVLSSKTKFYYSSLPNPDGSIKSGGRTYGKVGVDGVIVEITSGCYGSLVHETKHASQFASGDWNFNKESIDDDDRFGLINYDLQDEFDAYRQEFNYQFYIGKNQYYDDDYIKTKYVDSYKDKPFIIPEYTQYNESNPYKKN